MSDEPSTASALPEPGEPLPPPVMTRPRPRPLSSLVASARRLTSKDVTQGTYRKSTAQDWQTDSWEMYDLVGEERFLATTLAGRVAQAKMYVGEISDDPLADPVPTEDLRAQAVLDAVGGSASGRAQLVLRMAINLFVAGDGWFVGIPPYLMPGYDPEGAAAKSEWHRGQPLDVTDLEWRMLSVNEVMFGTGGEVTLILGDQEGEKVRATVDMLYLIRVWRPHPRRSWEAESPTRSSLPVLRELVGLTMHISAQIDSRLAGAGLLIVPQSAARSLREAAGLPEDSEEDPFTDALIEAMLTPIGDRSSASAQVPLVVTVPDESANLFQHLTFAKPLDTEARNLREEAIRRLALGQDAPPELLLGQAGMNHWGAWLVREDVVTTHIEPPLALICDALTTQYLRPVLRAMDYDEAAVDRFVVWYDVSDMVLRPNRAADAMTLYDKGVISDEALREATGFDDVDAPETADLDLATLTAFDLVKQNPQLIFDPGLDVLVTQIDALLNGQPLSAAQTAQQKAEQERLEAREKRLADARARAAGEPTSEDTAEEAAEGSEGGGGDSAAPGGPPDTEGADAPAEGTGESEGGDSTSNPSAPGFAKSSNGGAPPLSAEVQQQILDRLQDGRPMATYAGDVQPVRIRKAPGRDDD